MIKLAFEMAMSVIIEKDHQFYVKNVSIILIVICGFVMSPMLGHLKPFLIPHHICSKTYHVVNPRFFRNYAIISIV